MNLLLKTHFLSSIVTDNSKRLINLWRMYIQCIKVSHSLHCRAFIKKIKNGCQWYCYLSNAVRVNMNKYLSLHVIDCFHCVAYFTCICICIFLHGTRILSSPPSDFTGGSFHFEPCIKSFNALTKYWSILVNHKCQRSSHTIFFSPTQQITSLERLQDFQILLSSVITERDLLNL